MPGRALALAALIAAMLPVSAFGYAAGISAYSGMNVTTCNACHTPQSATNATLTLTGPTALTSGQVGTYTLTLSGGPGVKAGLDVAVDTAAATLSSSMN